MAEAAKAPDAPTDIAHIEPHSQPPVAPPDGSMSEAQALMMMVERASRDAAVNIDKMRELLAMRKEIMHAANEQKFWDAMSAAQGEMRAVAADANNPSTHSKYASYFALDKAVRPIYTRHGFALSFDTEDTGSPDSIRVVCYATCAGYTRKYQTPNMPTDGVGAKGGAVMTKTHATGSAMTYGQRYLLKMIFNMAIGDDNDGNAPVGPSERVTEKQVAILQAKIFAVAGDRADHLLSRLLAYMSKGGPQIDSLAELPAKEFDNAVTAIEDQRKNYK